MATAVFPAYGLARLAVRPALGALRRGGDGALAGARVCADPGQGADRLPGRDARPLPDRPLGWRTDDGVGSCSPRRPAVLGFLAKDQLVDPVRHSRARRRSRSSGAATGWPRSGARGRRATGSGAQHCWSARCSSRRRVRLAAIESWYVATTFFQDRMLEYGLWAAGALTIGLGIVPAGRRARVARAAQGRGGTAGRRRTRDRHGRLDRLLRPLHRGQGRVPLDRFRGR